MIYIQSTFFQLCWDDFLSSWVEQFSKSVLLQDTTHCLQRVSNFQNPSIPSLTCYQLSHCTPTNSYLSHISNMCRSRGGIRYPLKKHKHIGFLSNTAPDHLKNHKPTRPAFNVGQSSARCGSAKLMMARF